jgi:hypothetical protein
VRGLPGGPEGAFEVYTDQPRVWTREDFRLAAWIADQVGRAWQSVRLARQNRQQAELLARLIDHSPVAIAVVEGPELRYALTNPMYRGTPGSAAGTMGHGFDEAATHAPRELVPAFRSVMETGQLVIAFAGFFLARWLYRDAQNPLPAKLLANPNKAVRGVHRWVFHKYYVDEAYDRAVIRPSLSLSRFLARFDGNVIDADDAHHPHFSRKRVPGYVILLLLLELGVIGTFSAQDFFLFYVFWEVMLLPVGRRPPGTAPGRPA